MNLTVQITVTLVINNLPLMCVFLIWNYNPIDAIYSTNNIHFEYYELMLHPMKHGNKEITILTYN